MKYSVLAAVVLVAVALAARPVDAKPDSIAGTWTFSVEHLALKFDLDQKKSAVTGTLDWPHGDPIKLTGMFADDTLLLTGDSTGENFTIHVDSTGTRKADGTLAGTLKAHFDEFNDAHELVRARTQDIAWTAVRGLHGVVHFPR
jgi:hypothetical protein